MITTHTTPTEVFTVWHILLFDQKSKLAPVLYGKVLWQTHSTLRSVVPLAMFIFVDNHFVGCFPSGLSDTEQFEMHMQQISYSWSDHQLEPGQFPRVT